MANVIVFNIYDDAVALCNRLDPCRDAGDSGYSQPIADKDNTRWFVQILDKHVVNLTPEEFALLGTVPSDWFDQIP